MKNRKRIMTTKVLTYNALLTALSVVLARLFGLMPEASARYSIEAIPIFLSGLLFGPLAGGLVGFAADFIGCLFSPFGYNPIFCVPPILYGVFGGIFSGLLKRHFNLLSLLGAFLCPVVLGSVLYQSCSLAYIYYDGVFLEGLAFYLGTRSVQFAIVTVVDVLLIYILMRSNLFARMNLWPAIPKKHKKEVTL